MAKTSISISEHFDVFISSQIANGRYDTASEVIRAGLRLLEVQEMEFQSKQQALREALIAGENSGESDMLIDDIIAKAKQKWLSKRANI